MRTCPTTLTGLWLTVLVGVGASPACGGRSLDDGEGGSPALGGGATVNVGGRSAGGGASVGGSSGGGTASIGGAGAAAAGGTTSGGTGSGGAVMVGCTTPELYPCDAGTQSFVYFDQATGECTPSKEQCTRDGLANVFQTLGGCQKSCQGAPPALDACDIDADCVLAAGCCGPCESASLESFSAVNSVAYKPIFCDVACGACPDIPEHERNVEYFWPRCIEHVCTVIDLTESEFAACDSDDDCFLRDGAGCCGSCDGRNLIPLSSTDYLGSRCDLVDCASCDPPGQEEVTPRCDLATGHCRKVPIELP